MHQPGEIPHGNLRLALVNLLVAGNPPNGISPEDCGDEGYVLEDVNAGWYEGGTDGAKRVWSRMCKADPNLAKILSEDFAPRSRYTVHWASDAVQPEEPPRQVIDRSVHEGSLNIVVGDPGSGKTWLLLFAALCIAMGMDWLGRSVMQGVALIVDEESGGRRLRKRLRALMLGLDAPEDVPLAYVSLEQFDFRKEEDAAALQDLIRETKATFVVIDTLAAIMPGGDENAVKDVQPLFMLLRKVAEETRAAIVLIHHTGKNGNYRGSSAISGAVDLMLKVESRPGTKCVDVASEKARDVEPFTMAAHLRFEQEPEFKVYVDQADHTPKPTKLSAGEEYVLRHLSKTGSATVTDITGNADTCSAATARKAVYSLASRQRIRRTNQGGRGEDAVYALALPGDDARDYLPPYEDG